MAILTAARLREELQYNPKTGEFWWRKLHHRRTHDKCGYSNPRLGYLIIGIDRKTYRAHRLAWLWMTDEWPSSDIDHINGDPMDNRWANLRLATKSQNMRNHKLFKTNTSGMNGLHYDKSKNMWRLYEWGKYVAWFPTKEDAMRFVERRHKG